jgi:hypothetical protein
MTHGLIAYTYEAAHHCEECALARFGRDSAGDITGTDAEGNEVGALFEWDEWHVCIEHLSDFDLPAVLTCGTCGKAISEPCEDCREEIAERARHAVNVHQSAGLWRWTCSCMDGSDSQYFATRDGALADVLEHLLRESDDTVRIMDDTPARELTDGYVFRGTSGEYEPVELLDALVA